jgi:hypothetical protein
MRLLGRRVARARAARPLNGISVPSRPGVKFAMSAPPFQRTAPAQGRCAGAATADGQSEEVCPPSRMDTGETVFGSETQRPDRVFGHPFATPCASRWKPGNLSLALSFHPDGGLSGMNHNDER